MDDPSTATYYIGEIPFSAYSGEAQASIAGTTALVVIAVAAARAATSRATCWAI